MSKVYLSVLSNLMDRPNTFICHIMFWPIFPAERFAPFSSLLYYMAHITLFEKLQDTYLTILIITHNSGTVYETV